jgi:hypothetical protein
MSCTRDCGGWRLRSSSQSSRGFEPSASCYAAAGEETSRGGRQGTGVHLLLEK